MSRQGDTGIPLRERTPSSLSPSSTSIRIDFYFVVVGREKSQKSSELLYMIYVGEVD